MNIKNNNDTIKVPVLSSDGYPVMPCRPSRAKRLCKNGRAVKLWIDGIFAIKLVDRNYAELKVQNISINIDTGSENTGIAVVSGETIRTVLAALQLKHRSKQISRDLISRSGYRRNRRGRLRYRAPMFSNRHRPAGWLPPSLRHTVHFIERWVAILCKLYPVTGINIEANTFDTQKMMDPSIQGVEYQYGTLHGIQIKNYLLNKYNYTCVYCNIKNTRAKTTRLEVDHVMPRADKGSNRISNLVIACAKCNQAKNNIPVEDFVKNKVKLACIKSQLLALLVDATYVNVIVPKLISNLIELGHDVVKHDAATTAWNRKQLNVPKAHCYDAAVLGDLKEIYNLPVKVMMVTSLARQTHCKARVNKHSTPYGKGYPEYCKLDRRSQSKQPTPAHSTKQKRYGLDGIQSGDIAKIYHQDSKTERIGRCNIQNETSVVMRESKPSISGNIKTAKLISRNKGYEIKLEQIMIQK